MIGLGSDLIDIRRIENTLSNLEIGLKKEFLQKIDKKCEREKKVQLVMLRLQLRKLQQRLGTDLEMGILERFSYQSTSGKPTITFHGNSQLQLKKIANDREQTKFNNY